MPSPLETAKRALVALLRALGLAFHCQVTVTRDSSEQEVNRAFRKVARKVHPDKPGGNTEEFQKLSAAHDAWTELLRSRGSVGRPPKAPGGQAKAPAEADSALGLTGATKAEDTPEYRVHCQAVLLTYQGLSATLTVALAQWTRFLAFVQGRQGEWSVKYWTATLETNKTLCTPYTHS